MSELMCDGNGECFRLEAELIALREQVASLTRERDSWQRDYHAVTDTLHKADEATAFWRDKASELHTKLKAQQDQLRALEQEMRGCLRFPEAPGGSDVLPAHRVDEWADDLARVLAEQRS
jgi:chromosome segregation ATPase